MWQFLSGLISTFVLVRDALAYATPGLVFLSLAAFQTNTCQHRWYLDNHDKLAPFWAIALLVLLLAYVLGQLLLALGYTLLGIFKVDVANNRVGTKAGASDPLFYHYVYPRMFIEADRRKIIADMRLGVASSMLTACWFLPNVIPKCSVFAIGIFLGWNAYTGSKQVDEYTSLTVDAAKMAESKKVPFEMTKEVDAKAEAATD